MFDRVHAEGEVVRLHLRGDLDGAACSDLRQGLVDLVLGNAREVVIDISGVSHIDGSGIAAISFLFKRLAARNRRFSLCGATGQPLLMMRQLGLGNLLRPSAAGEASTVELTGVAWAR